MISFVPALLSSKADFFVVDLAVHIIEEYDIFGKI